jgi:hypothetical protein
MKSNTPLVVTIVLLALGFVLVARKENKPAVQPDKPEEIVYAMFDAAKTGQIRKYLNCFAPELRKELDQRRRDQGNGAFKRYLVERSQPVKGIALSEKQLGKESGTVQVEWVYQDRNEVQTVSLRKIGRDWKIAALTEGQRQEQLVPYGTPAYPLETDKDKAKKPKDQPYEYTDGAR